VARNYPVLIVSMTLMPLGTAFLFPCVTGLLSQVVPGSDRGLYMGVQQTFGGFLNFVPHLHVLVSAGGLMESRNRWIHHLKYDERELMCAWRYAVVAFLSEARKRNREEAGVPAAN